MSNLDDAALEKPDANALYDEWMKLVIFLNQPICGAQLQGTAVGCFVALSGLSLKKRLERFAHLFDIDQDSLAYEQLGMSFQALAQALDLKNPDFSFQLALPSDEEELTERAESLKWWCVGFIEGLQMKEGKPRYSSEVKEALEDIKAIASLDVEEIEADGEGDFQELVSYIEVMPKFLLSETIAERKGLH